MNIELLYKLFSYYILSFFHLSAYLLIMDIEREKKKLYSVYIITFLTSTLFLINFIFFFIEN